MNKIEIFYDKEQVGFLTYDAINDNFNFSYNDAWKLNGFELSPCIKFDSEITSKCIKNFIENLLPEGNGKEVLSIKNHISKNNIFGLIQIIGKETTGGSNFLSR